MSETGVVGVRPHWTVPARHVGSAVLCNAWGSVIPGASAAVMYSFVANCPAGRIEFVLDRTCIFEDVPAGVAGWGLLDATGNLIWWTVLDHAVEKGDTVRLYRR